MKEETRGISRTEFLLLEANKQAREDLARAFREPARELVTLIHNRAEALKDPSYQAAVFYEKNLDGYGEWA